jgi:hypothetical protein
MSLTLTKHEIASSRGGPWPIIQYRVGGLPREERRSLPILGKVTTIAGAYSTLREALMLIGRATTRPADDALAALQNEY